MMKTRNHPRCESGRLQQGLALLSLALAMAFAAGPAVADDDDEGDGVPHVMWVNHFDLLPGGSDLTTTFNSTSSGVGDGLTGLVIHSSTLGEDFASGGNKEVHMALDLPKETKITGVRVCYELSNPQTYISQIRLAQVQNPPATALVLLDDGTDLTDPGPVCVNSASTWIWSQAGSVLLSLRVFFGDTTDLIVVRALGLFVK